MSELATLAADVIVPPASCGITARTNGHPITVATQRPARSQVDEVQYGANKAPASKRSTPARSSTSRTCRRDTLAAIPTARPAARRPLLTVDPDHRRRQHWAQ